MARVPIALLVAVLAWLVPVSGAAAATLAVSKPCYPERSRQLAFSGHGFAPGATYRLRVDGVVVRSGRVGPGGAVAGSGLRVPPARGRQRPLRVTLTAGRTSASTTAHTTPSEARLVFLGGLEVRISVIGFGEGNPVYVHYVSPAGRAARTERLGLASGACGSLLGPVQPIFPFLPSPGTWVLQVDVQPSYRPRPPAPVERIDILVLRD